MPEMLVLEKSLVEHLSKLRKEAEESVGDLVEKTDHQVKELKASPERKEIQRLRRLLDRAEKQMHAKESEIQRAATERRAFIQREYDESRANAAADYFERRKKYEDDFMSCYGFSICQKCLRPFHPQQRACLPGHKRCSVAGCSSAERFCLDCCSAPCRNCYQPLCSAHEICHEVECSQVRSKICGYDIKMHNMGKGIRHGCCGKVGSPSQQCLSCGVIVCFNCSPKEVEEVGDVEFPSYRYRPLCPSCDAGRKGIDRPPVRIKWGESEYQEERKHHNRRSYKEFRLRTGLQPPGPYYRAPAYLSFNHSYLRLVPPIEDVKRNLCSEEIIKVQCKTIEYVKQKIGSEELSKVQGKTRLGKRRHR